MTKLNEKVMRNIDVMREKISKYDVFYTMCDKMIGFYYFYTISWGVSPT